MGLLQAGVSALHQYDMWISNDETDPRLDVEAHRFDEHVSIRTDQRDLIESDLLGFNDLPSNL